jgi:spore coat protein U-like protein
MQKFSLRAIAAAALVLASSSGFAATDSGSIAVSASVAAVCKLALSGGMAFGSLDPTATTDPTPIDVTATVKCTNGTAVSSVTVGGSTSGSITPSMTATLPATGSLGYKVTWTDPGAFAGVGMATAAKTFVIKGEIPFANIQGANPAAYTGSVSVVVNY